MDKTEIFEPEQFYSDVTTSDFTKVLSNSIDKAPKLFNKLYIKNPLREFLLRYELLSENEINKLESDKALNISKLIDSYLLNQDVLYKRLSHHFSIRYYEGIEQIVSNIDDSFMDIRLQQKMGILILLTKTREGIDEHFIVISDPFDFELKDHIIHFMPKTTKYNFSLAKKETIKKAMIKFVKDGNIKLQFNVENTTNVKILSASEIEEIEYSASVDVPIVPLVNYIILNAHENRVSDIHIEPTEENMLVRYRIDGVLSTDITLPNTIHREVVSRIKIISDMDVAEKRLAQDGRFSIQSKDGKTIDLRISTLPTVYGEKVVMRLLEQDAIRPKLEDLGIEYEYLDLFKKKISAPHGLILITGPTGSGKTTTLYSALSDVDKEKLNVVTLEDPIEYRLEGVNQTQTNETIGLTFASGLRTILRQDPDVIMLGEIRDLGTAQTAIRASLTGHMVFSTLHTNDSIGVIVRLITMGIDPYLVASSLSLVVAQRLVRKVCPHCATTQNHEELSKDLQRKGITTQRIISLGFDLSVIPDFVHGKGCSYCRGSGYLGRTAIFEFFELTDDIVKEILNRNIDEKRIRILAKENNIKTLADNAWQLVVEGVTTVEEIVRVIGE